MTKEQIKALVSAKIAGQGMQVDASGALPAIFDAILELEEGQVGDLAELLTDHKSDLVAAINELAGIAETDHLVVSMMKTSAELKEIYDACKDNIVMSKNIVLYNAEDGMYYRVNGYNMIDNVLTLHAIIPGESGLMDTAIGITSEGSII